jgi:hypothetical protein
MPTSSAFHFFARLLERRGYFVQDNKLEDFAFPRDMIAAESRSGFPDFVLKTNSDDLLTGGEFIELKDAKSYQIASFNSTLPSATKQVSSLAQNLKNQLLEAGEDIESVPQRDVYYLIRGMRRTMSSPLAKTVMVSGSFFETVSTDEVLSNAFHQVAAASTPDDVDVSEFTEHFEIRQSSFAETRRVEGSSISVRFRVMAQVDPRANLLNDNRYPMIEANTLTMLVHERRLTDSSLASEVYAWDRAPGAIRGCDGYGYLGEAFDEIDATLKTVVRVSVMRHPMNGPFFMAQAPIHP